MKSHSLGIQPTMKLTTSAAAINMQANLKAAEVEDIIHQDVTKPSKVWSDSVTAKYILTFAEGLFKSIQDWVHLYRLDALVYLLLRLHM